MSLLFFLQDISLWCSITRNLLIALHDKEYLLFQTFSGLISEIDTKGVGICSEGEEPDLINKYDVCIREMVEHCNLTMLVLHLPNRKKVFHDQLDDYGKA